VEVADDHEVSGDSGRSVWTLVGAVVVLAFLAALIIGNRGEFPNAWHAVRHARPAWLAVAGAAMVASLLNLGMFHAAAQRAAGLDTTPLALVGPAVGANFLNLVTKSGGLAGLVEIRAEARRRDLPRPPVLAAYLLVVLMGEWTFAVTLLMTLVVVWANGHLFTAEVVASCVFAVVLGVKVVATMAAWRSRAALHRLYSWPMRVRAWITRRPSPPWDTTAAEEFADSLAIIRQRPRRAIPVVAHAFAVEVLGIVQLYAVVAAVGQGHHIVVAFVAYSVGVLFAIVGFLPGGLGFVEVSVTAVLISFDVEAGAAAAAVLLYRVVELWLPVAIGGALTLRSRRMARSRVASAG
jgi:uncharacterized protein (TIRG00374 family)